MILVFELDTSNGQGVKLLGLYESAPSRDIDDPPITTVPYECRYGEKELEVSALFRINLGKLEVNG